MARRRSKAQLVAADGSLAIPSRRAQNRSWPASGELAHKPALACAISAGDGGAYVISELRMSGYKNNRLCWIPEHLIARRVNEICNPEDHKNNLERHRTFEGRAKYTLGLLISYGNSLKDIRSSGIIDHEAFPNGM